MSANNRYSKCKLRAILDDIFYVVEASLTILLHKKLINNASLPKMHGINEFYNLITIE